MQKKALSVQSLACHGKCSLTEALPLISAKGISLSVLPSVLLSTHTGGFGSPARFDTTEFLVSSIEHWKRENIKFDGAYVGYLADVKQGDLILENLENLINENPLILVDPVMGDKGKLFSGIGEDYPEMLLKLCRKADIITPNITESFLLCKEEYNADPTLDELTKLAKKLYKLTSAVVLITGVEVGEKIGVLFYDGEKTELISAEKQPLNFHGTGDLFASFLFAEVLRGVEIKKSAENACDFVSKSISDTISAGTEEKNGLLFEKRLLL